MIHNNNVNVNPELLHKVEVRKDLATKSNKERTKTLKPFSKES